MRKTIVWKGLYYQSLELCDVKTGDDRVEAVSTVLGVHDDQAFRLNYVIIAKPTWEIVRCRIESRWGDFTGIKDIQRDGEGNWVDNGDPVVDGKGCIDIDISLTPFTNALPINRLRLGVNEARVIEVLYVDVFGWKISRAVQRYTKLSDARYRFENVPNDFEAAITVDERGIVQDYPGLFTTLNG